MRNAKKVVFHRWIMLALFCMVVIVAGSYQVPAVYAAQNIAQGTWGDNVTWTIDENGVLTFSGKGEMKQGTVEWTDSMIDIPVKDRPEIFPWKQYAGKITKVIVGEGITNVPSSAFTKEIDTDSDESPYVKLENVQLASTVREIGAQAFCDCKALTEVNVPEQLEKIGIAAFSSCEALKDFTFPEGVTEIGDRAFINCKALTSITLPKKLVKMGSYAFSGCTGLTELIIPDQIESISNEAFSRCSGLVSVTIPNSVKKLGKSAFASCEGLQEVVISDNVTSLDSTFDACKALKSVTLPKKLEKLNYTFMHCSALEEIDLPETVTSLNGAFAGCKSLKKITVPKSVTKMDGKLFYGCTGLEELRILTEKVDLKKLDNKDVLFYNFSPKAVIILPDKKYSTYRAIMECFLPATVTYKNSKGKSPAVEASAQVIDSGTWGKNIKWKLTTNGKLTFSGKGAMKEGRAYYTNVTYGNIQRYPWCQYASYIKSVEIGNGITNVPAYAFSSKSDLGTINPFVQLKTLKLGKDVKVIGQSSFNECSKLKNFAFPAGLQEISYNAFQGCKSLTKLTFPGTVKKVMDYSFEKCSGLTSVTFEKNKNEKMILEYAAFRRCKKLKKVVLPDNVRNMQHTFEGCVAIESIKLPKQLKQMEAVFRKCKKLKSITIPENVETMLFRNFEECKSLKSVVFKTKKLENIGGADFYNCVSLTEITLPKSLKQIGGSAFTGTRITEIVIPGRVKVIAYGAFRDCPVLEKVTFEKNSNSTVTFERCVFKDCKALKEINIPDNVKKLKYAFQNCTALEKIQLPKKLVLIESAFTNCTSLKELTIPSEVTQISNGSFKNCSSLKKVVFLTEKWAVPEPADTLFAGIASDAEITLPAAKYDEYKKAIEASAPETVAYQRGSK